MYLNDFIKYWNWKNVFYVEMNIQNHVHHVVLNEKVTDCFFFLDIDVLYSIMCAFMFIQSVQPCKGV